MRPACNTVDMLVKMIEKGMNVARLNFSHGDHEVVPNYSHQYHAKTVENVKEASTITGVPIGIMLDTKGPEIRTGFLENHKPIELVEGQLLEITNDYTFLGNNKKIACSYFNIHESLEIDDTVLIADGSIIGKVKDHLDVINKFDFRMESLLRS